MNPKETPKTKVFGKSGVRFQGPLVTPRVLPEVSQPRQSRSLSGSQEPPNLEDELTDKSPLLKTSPRVGGPTPTSPHQPLPACSRWAGGLRGGSPLFLSSLLQAKNRLLTLWGRAGARGAAVPPGTKGSGRKGREQSLVPCCAWPARGAQRPDSEGSLCTTK